jgi:hypothetical protein
MKMGSWYEDLKKLPKPRGIIIRPFGSKLKVILHYDGNRKDREIIIDNAVLLDLIGVGLDVEKGELWGDWGGADKGGDIIYIHKPEPRGKLPQVKVNLI